MSVCVNYSGDLLDGRGDPSGRDLIGSHVHVSNARTLASSTNFTTLLQGKLTSGISVFRAVVQILQNVW